MYAASVGVRLPLNSRRPKADHLHQLAAALGMAVKASGDEFHQMIDGKLIGEGKETRNIQAVLAEGPSSEFFLEDADGRFLTVPATMEGTQAEPSEPSKHDTGEKSQLEVGTL